MAHLFFGHVQLEVCTVCTPQNFVNMQKNMMGMDTGIARNFQRGLYPVFPAVLILELLQFLENYSVSRNSILIWTTGAWITWQT